MLTFRVVRSVVGSKLNQHQHRHQSSSTPRAKCPSSSLDPSVSIIISFIERLPARLQDVFNSTRLDLIESSTQCLFPEWN